MDGFVVMPNHLHGIVVLEKRVECIQPLQNQNNRNQIVGVQYIEPTAGKGTARDKYQHVTPKSIGSIVRSYKAAVTRKCRENSLEGLIWQRNSWEHVIRSEEKMNKIREYIIANPAQWETDPENPKVCIRQNDVFTRHL
jgi:REP element-mobilizing transposase RayT